MDILYQHLLGGITMTPNQQDIETAVNIVEQFLAQTTDRLVIVVVALFVIFLIMGTVVTLYLLRNQGKRDNSTNTVVEQLSLIIAQQTKIIEQRDLEYRAQLKEVSERNARADALHNQAAETLKGVQLFTQESLRGLQQTQARSLDVLTEHDQWARPAVKEIMAALNNIEVKVDDARKTIGEIKAFFPDGTSRLAKVERELAEAIELLKDCGKRATDEKPVVILPDITPVEPEPETDIKQEPGTATNEDAA